MDDRGIFPSHRGADAHTHTLNPLLSFLSPNKCDERDERKREIEKKREKKLLLYGEESSIVSSLPPFFLPPLREGCPRERFADDGTKRRNTFIYVCPIDSLLYGARGKRRLCWTPDAEESKASADAASVVARTEMDSGSKEREIRGGMLGMDEGWKRRACV